MSSQAVQGSYQFNPVTEEGFLEKTEEMSREIIGRIGVISDKIKEIELLKKKLTGNPDALLLTRLLIIMNTLKIEANVIKITLIALEELNRSLFKLILAQSNSNESCQGLKDLPFKVFFISKLPVIQELFQVTPKSENELLKKTEEISMMIIGRLQLVSSETLKIEALEKEKVSISSQSSPSVKKINAFSKESKATKIVLAKLELLNTNLVKQNLAQLESEETMEEFKCLFSKK